MTTAAGSESRGGEERRERERADVSARGKRNLKGSLTPQTNKHTKVDAWRD